MSRRLRRTTSLQGFFVMGGGNIKKVFIIAIILEILLIVAGNILCLSADKNTEDHSYRVEIKRLVSELSHDGTSIGPEYTPDAEKYPHIRIVRPFDPKESADGEYAVEEIDGALYRIEYVAEKEVFPVIYMNIALVAMLLITVILFIFIERKIVRPFASMEKLAVELARGNLSMPVQEEKSRLFGKFLWGMDMLREQLEESREKEKAYLKDRKMLMLSLSHDIKTPLAALELYTKALSSGLYDTPEKQAEAYAGMQKNVDSLKRYIEEITAASRDDFLALEVKDGDCYVDDVVSEIREYYSQKFMTLHTAFAIAEHANPLVKGDRDRLVEVIQNLLENAVKYGDGREVGLSFSEEDEAVLIHVKNSGEAPPEEEMLHLFDSFYRGSNVGEKKGSGLGLYISRELMKRMGGELYATGGEGYFEAVVVMMKS